jgi:hypothetical protein
MTGTSADIDDDADTIADITTLDEFDGSGYSSGGVTLTGEAVTEDSANDRAEFNANSAAFGALGAGATDVQAAIVIKWNSTLNDSEPLAYVDTGGFPFTANGSTVTINWNAEGIIQAT